VDGVSHAVPSNTRAHSESDPDSCYVFLCHPRLFQFGSCITFGMSNGLLRDAISKREQSISVFRNFRRSLNHQELYGSHPRRAPPASSHNICGISTFSLTAPETGWQSPSLEQPSFRHTVILSMYLNNTFLQLRAGISRMMLANRATNIMIIKRTDVSCFSKTRHKSCLHRKY
jgi:hypothetical protein